MNQGSQTLAYRRVRKENLEEQALRVLQEGLDPEGTQVVDVMDLQATKAQKVQMALQEAKDSQDPMDQRDPRVHQVQVVIQVPKATKARMGSRGHRGRKEKPLQLSGLREDAVIQVQQVLLETPVLLAFLMEEVLDQ